MRELTFILTTTAGTFTLDVSPDGWDSSMITFERSEKYFGVFRSWTIPLKFVKTGALELRREFYTYGQNGTGSIVIHKLDKVTQNYNIAFKGTLDFTTFRDSENYVEVTFHDSGAAKLLKDYGGTEYEVENSLMTSLTTYEASDADFSYLGKTYYGVELLNLGFNLLNKMSNGMVTDQTLKIQSDYLTNYTYNEFEEEKLIFIPGAQLGNENQRFGSFKCSFEQWFNTLNSIFCLGIGIELDQDGITEIVRIEPRDYFLLTTEAMDFGTVENLDILMAQKMLFKTVEIGYPEKDYKSYPKPTEICATSKWEIRTESVNTKLEIVSKFRGDAMGIQDTIHNLDGDTIDDIWIALIRDPGSAWQLDLDGKVRQIGTTVPVYNRGNLLISPRRNLERWADYLSNCTYGMDGENLVFTAGQNQMRIYESSLDGILAYENEIDPVQLSQRTRFFPIQFEIEVPAPADFINTLVNNANKIFTFGYKGSTYGGYIMKVVAKVIGKTSQKITFLASNQYQNALYNLIYRRNG